VRRPWRRGRVPPGDAGVEVVEVVGIVDHGVVHFTSVSKRPSAQPALKSGQTLPHRAREKPSRAYVFPAARQALLRKRAPNRPENSGIFVRGD